MATKAISGWIRGILIYDVAEPDPSGNIKMVLVFGPIVPWRIIDVDRGGAFFGVT